MVRHCEVGCLNQGNESVIVHLSFLQCSFRPCVVAELNSSSTLKSTVVVDRGNVTKTVLLTNKLWN